MTVTTLAVVRREQILAEVTQARFVNVAELIHRFGVSYMTVWRDLDVLERAGRLTRVHGGAMLAQTPENVAPVATTRPTAALSDMALAYAAAKMIDPGSTIALARGSRACALARRVAAIPGVTVVTNSLWVAQILYEHGKAQETLLTGGMGGSGGGLVGPAVANALRGIRIDTFFYDADGIDARAGLTTPHFADAIADSALLEAAASVVAFAPSALWGRVNLCPVAPLSAARALITDQLTSDMHDAIDGTIKQIVALRGFEACNRPLQNRNFDHRGDASSSNPASHALHH